MGDIINLNQYRKRRERDEKARKARGNRAKSGRTRADQATQRHEAEKTGEELDRKRLAPAATEEPGTDPNAKPDTKREPPEDSTPSAG
jgi:hypothetical protein